MTLLLTFVTSDVGRGSSFSGTGQGQNPWKRAGTLRGTVGMWEGLITIGNRWPKSLTYLSDELAEVIRSVAMYKSWYHCYV